MRGRKQNIDNIEWAVADCETDPFRHGHKIKPFIWAQTTDGKTATTYEGPNATELFLDWLRNFEGIVYAHNGGKFDWMMEEILDEIDGELMLINGRIARAFIGKAEIRDSWLCLPVPLRAFEKEGFDYRWLREENRAANMDKIRDYVKSDVINLHYPLDRFFRMMGEIPLTQAGAALKTWEKMGGEKRRYGSAHDAYFRPFFFGGRTQVFEYVKGAGPFDLYDINSSYPDAMRYEHCAGTNYTITKNIERVHDNPSSFWEITAISRGALPVRSDTGGVDFPVSDQPRDFLCTGWEIIAGIDTGTLDVLSVSRGLIPERTESLAPYVEWAIAGKEAAENAGDKTGRTLYKLLANSCYGKFATNIDTYHDYFAGDYPGDDWGPYLIKDNEVQIWKRKSESGEFLDVALAASITGYARAHLWRAICGANRVIYCDTDSILCESPGALNVGPHLGQWAHELTADRAWIAGKKLYGLECRDGKGKRFNKVASKGVQMTLKQIKRVCDGKTVTIYNRAPSIKISGEQQYLTRNIKMT